MLEDDEIRVTRIRNLLFLKEDKGARVLGEDVSFGAKDKGLMCLAIKEDEGVRSHARSKEMRNEIA